MQIHEAPHGINLVVETPETVYIGRFDSTNGFQVVMHDCSVQALSDPGERERFIKNTAKYGVAVDERDVVFDAAAVERVRVLGEIEKD